MIIVDPVLLAAFSGQALEQLELSLQSALLVVQQEREDRKGPFLWARSRPWDTAAAAAAASFDGFDGFLGRIPLIKLVRVVTKMGLHESKASLEHTEWHKLGPASRFLGAPLQLFDGRSGHTTVPFEEAHFARFEHNLDLCVAQKAPED